MSDHVVSRLTRRRFLRRASVLGSAAVGGLLLSCSSPQSATPPAPTSPPKPAEKSAAPTAAPAVAPVPTSAAASTSAPAATAPKPAAPGAVTFPQELVEAATREGQVVVYSARPSDLEKSVKETFEQRFPGITMETFREGGERVAQKYELELRAGQHLVDAQHQADLTIALDYADRDLLMDYMPQNAADIPARWKRDKERFLSVVLQIIPIGHNLNAVKAEDAPKTWKDLDDPKWHGKLTLASPQYSGSALANIAAWRELYGWEYIEALGKLQPQQAQGYGDTENLIISGERPVGVLLSHRASSQLQRGQQLGIVWPEDGAIVVEPPIFAMARAPHPNAAKLYLEWTASDEGAAVFTNFGSYSTRPGAPVPAKLPPLDSLKLKTVDWDYVVKNRDELKDRWTRVMG